jgi:hypothetical protein
MSIKWTHDSVRKEAKEYETKGALQKGSRWQGQDGNYYVMRATRVSKSHLLLKLQERGVWQGEDGDYYCMAATKIT